MMPKHSDYLEKNQKLWDLYTESHVISEFYDLPGFKEHKNSLNSIEIKQLGSIKNKTILHLQCHFGQDTLSFQHLGAKATGVDFSPKAIQYAEQLANELNLETQFICSDIYTLPAHLNQEFDIVYTSYGVICWLPDLNKWAKIIRQFLKPGGEFHLVEFHPMLWMFDDNFQKIIYSYFNKEAISYQAEGSYVDNGTEINSPAVNFNHSLSDVITALLQQGLKIEEFQEFDYSPYDCFDHTIEVGPKQYQIKALEGKLPMLFALKAVVQ